MWELTQTCAHYVFSDYPDRRGWTEGWFWAVKGTKYSYVVQVKFLLRNLAFHRDYVTHGQHWQVWGWITLTLRPLDPSRSTNEMGKFNKGGWKWMAMWINQTQNCTYSVIAFYKELKQAKLICDISNQDSG